MSFSPYQPSQIFVEKSIISHPVTKRILRKLPQLTPQTIDDLSNFLLENIPSQQNIKPHNKPLVLALQKSEFFKKCPGTQKHICCGYQVLNLVNNCEINCSYCILQGYLNSPYIIIYVNIEDMFSELKNEFHNNPDKKYRIGTGEFADSLSTDLLTDYSTQLVSFFKNYKNVVFELKSKTTLIDSFINEQHNGRTICAWSLNTIKISKSEESLAPSIEKRLIAAGKCQQAGFKLAFHFDPMIYYDGWENDYKFVVTKMLETINPKNIIWISLGALRYPPHLDSIIRENHPHSKIVYGELFPGIDGKMRYFKPLRIKMFSKMYQWIKDIAPDVFVYLCMESSEVWQKSFGWTPKTSYGLKKIMDDLV